MKKTKPGVKPTYDNALKVAVAREYLTSNLSSGELQRKYNLPYVHCAHYFVQWYKKTYPDELSQHTKVIADVPGTLCSDRTLLNELKEANLKIAGLEMMIQIAQKELGIDIVKKSGTKQSSK